MWLSRARAEGSYFLKMLRMQNLAVEEPAVDIGMTPSLMTPDLAVADVESGEVSPLGGRPRQDSVGKQDSVGAWLYPCTLESFVQLSLFSKQRYDWAVAIVGT